MKSRRSPLSTGRRDRPVIALISCCRKTDASIATRITQLNAAGVGTSVHYPLPVPLMRYYRDKYGYRDGDFPVAQWINTQARYRCPSARMSPPTMQDSSPRLSTSCHSIAQGELPYDRSLDLSYDNVNLKGERLMLLGEPVLSVIIWHWNSAARARTS